MKPHPRPGHRDDRRANQRIGVSMRAVVLARHNLGLAMTVESLSLGGARLCGVGTFEMGELVTVDLELDGQPIQATAEVIRVEHKSFDTDRIAVRFVTMSPPHRDVLRAAIAQVLGIQYADEKS
jgi:hypothetical protein